MGGRDFELLEHPADLGFRAFGVTLPDLFAQSALALLTIASDPNAALPGAEYALSVESGDRESLLVDWLNEVLYWFDGRRIAFRELRVLQYSDTALSALGVGECRDPERHRARIIVKAATYHQLRIDCRDGLWSAEVYLDI